MARFPDPRVRLRWVRLLERFEKSNLTVSDLCQMHHVSVASLYKWRKRLAGELVVAVEDVVAEETTTEGAAFVPVHVVTGRDDLISSVVRFPGGISIEIDPRNFGVLVAVTGRLADELM
ncbi:MAG: transposase [Pirellulaceae bacterium]